MDTANSITPQRYLPSLRIGLIAGILLFAAFGVIGYALGMVWLPALLVVLPVLVIAAFYVLHNPFPLVVLMFMGVYLGSVANVIQDGVIPISPFQIIMALLFFVFVFNRMISGKKELVTTGIETELLLFLTILAATIIYSPEHMTGVINLARLMVLLVMMYVVINIIQTQQQMVYLYIGIVLMATVLAMMLLAHIVANPQNAIQAMLTDGANLRRTSITDIDPNRMAAQFLLPVSFLSAITLSAMKMRYRIVSAGLLFIALLGIAGSYSRSVMLATLIIMVVIALLYRQYKLFLWIGGISLVIILIVPEFRMFAGNVINRFLAIFAGSSDASSGIRIMLGIAGINMFVDSYMMGVGFGGFSSHFTNYFTLQQSIGVNMPHNVIYKLMAETGLLGITVYLFIIWKVLLTGYQNIKNSDEKIIRANSVTAFATFLGLFLFYQFYGGALHDNLLWLSAGLIFLQKKLIITEHISENHTSSK